MDTSKVMQIAVEKVVKYNPNEDLVIVVGYWIVKKYEKPQRKWDYLIEGFAEGNEKTIDKYINNLKSHPKEITLYIDKHKLTIKITTAPKKSIGKSDYTSIPEIWKLKFRMFVKLGEADEK